jgi:hypothetical protein
LFPTEEPALAHRPRENIIHPAAMYEARMRELEAANIPSKRFEAPCFYYLWVRESRKKENYIMRTTGL